MWGTLTARLLGIKALPTANSQGSVVVSWQEWGWWYREEALRTLHPYDGQQTGRKLSWT